MMFSNRNGIALYYRIAEHIQGKIVNNEWPEGYKLPSEPELAKHFNVSRSTIRQALSDLVTRGVIMRKRGLGTFVAKPSHEINFFQNLFPMDFGKKHKLISIKHLDCTPMLQQCLNIPPQTIVTEIFRVRFIKDDPEPALIEKSYYDQKVFPEIEFMDLSGKIYDYITNRYSIPLVKAKTSIEPVLLTLDEALALECTPDNPALMVTRICYSYSSQPIIMTKKLVRPDKCKLSVEEEL